jgi:hypothetical protein
MAATLLEASTRCERRSSLYITRASRKALRQTRAALGAGYRFRSTVSGTRVPYGVERARRVK